ncbi:cathelicidin-related peptide Oh-Cath-like [Rhineura floridana]|uniref:cathelicidin-related peptide Oh-Cath-like n=1 Tax=Rhineura floridana TaxID=261503 RepID=UPI002AC85420|nr:cathelicidin-related peptide Oh-Cath-like [Rhineura floridana]
MESCFWTVLLVAGAVATTATLPPLQNLLSYEEALVHAVNLYNQKAGENVTFQLLEAAPKPDWDANSGSAQELNFTIKEMECLAEEEHPAEECNFRDDGLVKECSGFYFMDENPPVAFITCEGAEDQPQPRRVKRSWLKKVLKKGKKSLSKFFKKKGIMVGGTIRYLEKMESYKAVLLVIGVVTAAPSAPTPLSYEQVIASAVDTYNQEQKPEFAFRLLEAEPQEDWDASSETIQPLKFSIKETICRSTEKTDVSQCEYKQDGVDRDCSGFYSAQQTPPIIIVQCEDVDQELNRITRGRWRKFWRKTKSFVKKHGVSIALAAVRFG